jgi:hypothetical protein
MDLSATDLMYTKKILTMFVGAFVFIAAVSKALGPERKARWFRKRTKYTILSRRSIFGEFIHFGYPCTLEGVLVFLATFGSIFLFGYWYIFL